MKGGAKLYYQGQNYDQFFVMTEMDRCNKLREEGKMCEKEFINRKVELILLEITRRKRD